MQGLCALDSRFPRFTLCVHMCGACVHLSWFPGLASASQVKCGLVSPLPALFVVGLIFFSFSAVAGGLCTLPKFVCLPSNGTPVPTLHPLGLSAGYLGYLGPPSMLQRLFTLAGFVCPNTRGADQPSVLQGLWCTGWVHMLHNSRFL